MFGIVILAKLAQTVAIFQQDFVTTVQAAEALRNAHPVNICALVLIHTIVLVDTGIPELIAPTDATRQRDSATAILVAAVEVHQNVHQVTINAAVLIRTIVHMALGLQTNTVPTAAIHQQANVKVVLVAEVHQNAHRVTINVAVLIRTIVHMVLGHQINIVQTAVIHQQANAKAVQAVEVRLLGTNRVLMILMGHILAQTAHI